MATLAFSNSQGELSPLETGVAANRYVELHGGGRGKKGGLSEFARRCGKSKQYISQSRSAAEVLKAVNRQDNLMVSDFLDKTQHLATIHRTPEEAWVPLVDQLVKKGWTIKDTERWVEKVMHFEVPEEWAFFLPPERVVEKLLITREFASVDALTTV